jgi:hypothetical protein
MTATLPRKRRYRVLAGKHHQRDIVRDDQGNPVMIPDGAGGKMQKTVQKTYKAGEVFESEEDMLAEIYNPPEFPGQPYQQRPPQFRKFALADEAEAHADDPTYLEGKIQEYQRMLAEARARQSLESGSTEARQPAAPKAEAVSPQTQQGLAQARAAYAKLSMEELRAKAEELELDTAKLKSKDDLVKALLPG